jgi:hypothetical protein
MSFQKVEDPTDPVRRWVREHGGTCLWREPVSSGRISCYRVIDEEGRPKLFFVQRFENGGFDVYLPATESNKIDDTLDALDGWLES